LESRADLTVPISMYVRSTSRCWGIQ
jgi:hypothetical protein